MKKKQGRYCEKHEHWYEIWENKSWREPLLFIYPSSVQGCATLPWTIFVITPELLKVLRENFDSSKIFSLVILLGQNHTPLHRLRMRICLLLKLDQTLQTDYLTFLNGFFGSQVRNMFKTFLIMSPWNKKLIS